MSWTEVVIGFDTRLAPRGAAPAWDEARRATFLLTDVPWPLSVDEAVWLRKDTSVVAGVGLTVETPRFRSAADAVAACGPDEWAVAITQWIGPGEPDVADPLGGVDPEWERLGYDVAEGVFPSGLSNCGYTDLDAATLSARFGAALNERHLFDDLPTAFAFRDATARRVQEHGPFAIVGLYRVDGGRGDPARSGASTRERGP